MWLCLVCNGHESRKLKTQYMFYLNSNSHNLILKHAHSFNIVSIRNYVTTVKYSWYNMTHLTGTMYIVPVYYYKEI